MPVVHVDLHEDGLGFEEGPVRHDHHDEHRLQDRHAGLLPDDRPQHGAQPVSSTASNSPTMSRPISSACSTAGRRRRTTGKIRPGPICCRAPGRSRTSISRSCRSAGPTPTSPTRRSRRWFNSSQACARAGAGLQGGNGQAELRCAILAATLSGDHRQEEHNDRSRHRPEVADPVEVEAGKTYYWCTCGKSAKQPLCDGALDLARNSRRWPGPRRKPRPPISAPGC